MSKFSFFLTLYVLLGIFAICIVMLVLWGYASAYEKAQPETAVEEYILQLNETGWDEGIDAAAARLNAPYQSPEDRNGQVSAYLSAGVGYALTVNGGDQTSKVYALLSRDTKVGTLTVEPDMEAKKHFGMRPWRVRSAEYDFSFLAHSNSLTLPYNFTVTVNGITLGEEAVTASGISMDCLAEYYAVCEGLATKTTYYYEYVSFDTPPDVRIYDCYGSEYTFNDQADDSQFLDICSQETVDALKDFAARFTRRYLTFRAGYTLEGQSVYDVYDLLAPYFVNGSALQNRVYSACDGLTWAHCAYLDIRNITLLSAWDIGNNQYIIDISAEVETVDPHGDVTRTENMRCVVADYSGDRRVLHIIEY